MANWEPIEGSEKYIHRSEWPEAHIRTVSEQKTTPYPENLVVMCIDSYGDSGEGTFKFLPPLFDDQSRVYCRALKRSKTTPYKYEVEMDVQIDGKSHKIVVEDVTAEGIFLYERAFAADWHLPNSFRHEIMIPDDIFPEIWKNGPWTEDMKLLDAADLGDMDLEDELLVDGLYDEDDEDDDAFD